MFLRENKNWLIAGLFFIIDFSIVLSILTFGKVTSFTDRTFLIIIFCISVLPFIILTIWIIRLIVCSKNLKVDRNWMILGFYFFAIILIIYIINIFSPFGLVFWEIAYILTFPCIISSIWCIKRLLAIKRERKPRYKKEIITFSLIIYIGFSIFAILPSVSVFPLGQQFEKKFKAKLGADYWDNIPKKYRDRLKAPGRFFDPIDLRYFFNRDVEVEKIEYGKKDYQFFEKYEDLTLKDDDKPAFIYIHGGGSLESEPGGSGKWECTYFASLGFVSFSIEYTPAPIEPFPQAVADVMKAIVYIKAHADKYDIDNDSIALFGPSRGGNLVTLVSYVGVNNDDWWKEHGANYTESQLEVTCVIDMYGAVDQFYGAEHNQFIADRNEIIFDGTPDDQEKIYKQHTVANFISDDVPPTLIFHGTLDGMVSVGESHRLINELEDEGADFIYLEYPLGQHGFDAVPGTAGNTLTYYFIPRFILANLYGEGFK